MHDAETIDEIIEVVVGELGELGRVVAEQVELELRIPLGVEIEVIGSSYAKIESERVVCSLGSLLGSTNRQIAFKITAPQATIGEQLEFEANFRWHVPGDAAGKNSSTQRADLTFARGQDNSRQSRDQRRSIVVAKLWQSEVVRKAVGLNRDGDYFAAIDLLKTELRYFERYCKGLSGTADLVEQLRRMLGSIDRPWAERSRKEVELATYKHTLGERDIRLQSRDSWDSYIPKS